MSLSVRLKTFTGNNKLLYLQYLSNEIVLNLFLDDLSMCNYNDFTINTLNYLLFIFQIHFVTSRVTKLKFRT
ncbi:hypothetical protein EV143_10349 [Flavobacterium chryseum]|nr:hypothetical protein EV143_10349 [Flavobacterium sp. P3160]